MLFDCINYELEKTEDIHTHIYREEGLNLFVGMINDVSPVDRNIHNYWR